VHAGDVDAAIDTLPLPLLRTFAAFAAPLPDLHDKM
jgi:hypothetical protein